MVENVDLSQGFKIQNLEHILKYFSWSWHRHFAMSGKERKKYGWQKLISVLFNPWFWDFIWKKIQRFFYPSSIKLYGPAPDAQLVGLDGVSKISLMKDYIEKSPDIPLILNFGSYN